MKNKKVYTNRDEFINDDKIMTDDEESEAMQTILESLEEKEREM